MYWLLLTLWEGMSKITVRLHFLGAPGAGVTTLGRSVAEHLSLPHFDTDNYHWFTDDALPYRRRRNPEHRIKLMEQDLSAQSGWVLSGALCGWGDVFVPRFQAVIYCELNAAQRLVRIQEREKVRYGAERLSPGGDLHSVYEKFCAWAAAYEEKSDKLRSRDKEMEWLARLTCPVLQLDTSAPLQALAAQVLHFVDAVSIKKI